jgi:predicted RNase H-like HicB family nuclease
MGGGYCAARIVTYRLWYNRRFTHMLDSLPDDVRAQARQAIYGLTRQPSPDAAKELEDHPGYWRMWLPRNHRLSWRVLEEEQLVNLLYLGPKPPDLYEQLGLGKRLREADEAPVYEVERDRNRSTTTMENKFTAVFEQEGEWWIGYVEELPGANTQGATLPEARENLKEAIQLVLEANRELTRREVEGKTLIREDILVTI